MSINLNLAKCDDEIEYYWSKTGRPSMLMNILKRGGLLAINPERDSAVSDEDSDVSDLANLRAVPMLYQTGYLTIKNYLSNVDPAKGTASRHPPSTPTSRWSDVLHGGGTDMVYSCP